MARPTKLDDKTQDAIVTAIKLGATYQAAAEYAGVSYSTFNVWMGKRGRLYVKFQEAVSQANAQARVNLLAKIQTAASDGDWRAAAWILERRFRDEYGPSLALGKMTDAELLAFIQHELEAVGVGVGGSEAAQIVAAGSGASVDAHAHDGDGLG